jgi:hypothetical protein
VAGDYSHRMAIRFNPRVLSWLPAVLLVIVFFCTLPAWLGVFAGGIPVVTQNAWGAAFGAEPTWHEKDIFRPFSEERLKPGANGLMICYLICLLLALLLAVASAVAPLVRAPLPPQVQQFIPYRWPLTALLTGLALFFLVIQLLIGFTLERHATKVVEEEIKAKKEASEKEKREFEVKSEFYLTAIQRTNWLRFAFFLHLFALIFSLLALWVIHRAERPHPRLELLW